MLNPHKAFENLKEVPLQNSDLNYSVSKSAIVIFEILISQ